MQQWLRTAAAFSGTLHRFLPILLSGAGLRQKYCAAILLRRIVVILSGAIGLSPPGAQA
jgi:hypothetical protein